MRRLTIALLLTVSSYQASAQWVVHDPIAYLQDLLHYIEQVEQISEWKDQAEMLKSNLESLGDGYRQLFATVLQAVESEKGDQFLNDLLRIDPSSSNFDDQLVALLEHHFGRIKSGDDLDVMYQEFPVEGLDVPIALHQRRYERFVDRREYYAGVEEASQIRLAKAQQLQGTAQGLGEEDEMRALQTIIAQGAASAQAQEQIISLLIEQAQDGVEKEVQQIQRDQIAIEAIYRLRARAAQPVETMADEFDDALASPFGGGN